MDVTWPVEGFQDNSQGSLRIYPQHDIEVRTTAPCPVFGMLVLVPG